MRKSKQGLPECGYRKHDSGGLFGEACGDMYNKKDFEGRWYCSFLGLGSLRKGYIKSWKYSNRGHSDFVLKKHVEPLYEHFVLFFFFLSPLIPSAGTLGSVHNLCSPVYMMGLATRQILQVFAQRPQLILDCFCKHAGPWQHVFSREVPHLTLVCRAPRKGVCPMAEVAKLLELSLNTNSSLWHACHRFAVMHSSV